MYDTLRDTSSYPPEYGSAKDDAPLSTGDVTKIKGMDLEVLYITADKSTTLMQRLVSILDTRDVAKDQRYGPKSSVSHS